MQESHICGGIFDLARKESRVKELEELMEDQDFWKDADAAQKVIAEVKELRSWTVGYENLKKSFEAVKDILPDAKEMDDPSLLNELVTEIQRIELQLAELEVRKMLSGELDSKNCYLSINAGAGGTEACDWAQMLARMYQRWAAKRHWNIDLVDTVAGDVAGIKSVDF